MISRAFLRLAAGRPLRALVLAGGLTALPTLASAQTYGDRNFPFCLQAYAPIQFIDCRYTSLPQCQATASGRSAMCVQNPYFDPGEPPTRRKRYRQS